MLRRLINRIFEFFIAKSRRKRELLKADGQKQLADHLAAIDFLQTQRLVNQFAPRFSDKKNPIAMPRTCNTLLFLCI